MEENTKKEHPLFNVTPYFLYYRLFFAGLAILAFLLTWYLDLMSIVHQCPYCRVQRTIIGLLGVIALLTPHKNTLLRYFCYLLAFFGADIAGDQMFLSIKAGTFPTPNFLFATLSLILIAMLAGINHYNLRDIDGKKYQKDNP